MSPVRQAYPDSRRTANRVNEFFTAGAADAPVGHHEPDAIVSDQFCNCPTSAAALSVIRNSQTPRVLLPSNPESTCAGRNEPLNGAAPAASVADASSSNVVFVKLSPAPPRRSNSRTVVPSRPPQVDREVGYVRVRQVDQHVQVRDRDVLGHRDLARHGREVGDVDGHIRAIRRGPGRDPVGERADELVLRRLAVEAVVVLVHPVSGKVGNVRPTRTVNVPFDVLASYLMSN